MNTPQPAIGAAQTLAPLNIDIGGVGSWPFKSIDDLAWHDIPPFAVLTGLNGSGKTQLLELLAYVITKADHPERINIGKTNVAISGDTFEPDDVTYLASLGGGFGANALGIAHLQHAKQQLWQTLDKTKQNNDIRSIYRRTRFARLFGVSELSNISKEEFSRTLSDDCAFMIDDINVISGLSYVFLSYRMRYLQELENDVPRESIVSKLGPAPWDVVNEVLKQQILLTVLSLQQSHHCSMFTNSN
jgi:hypothetical protein